jgi:hypothetical protein
MCSGLTTFTLPAEGREAASGAGTYAASTYPPGGNVLFDSTQSAIKFGPTTPTVPSI